MKIREFRKEEKKKEKKGYWKKNRNDLLTLSCTSATFLEATSPNFQPTSATLLVIFEAPIENIDQLCKEINDYQC